MNRIGYQTIHEAIWLGQDTRRYHDTIRALVAGGVELTHRSSNEGLTPLQMAQRRGYSGTEAILRTALDPPEIPDPDAALDGEDLKNMTVRVEPVQPVPTILGVHLLCQTP